MDRRSAHVREVTSEPPRGAKGAAEAAADADGTVTRTCAPGALSEGRGTVRTKRWLAFGLLSVTLLLVSCSKDMPQNTMDPAGPTAQTEKNLLVLVLWPAAAVFLIVEGGILLIGLKYRHRKGRDRMPPQPHGHTRLEIGWTIAPAIVLAVIMVPTVSKIWELARQPSDAMHVTVEGFQWWWGFSYTDTDMTVDYGQRGPIMTADVLVVPTGRNIDLSLTSLGGGARDNAGVPDHEVIHSFWVPRLFGKQDVIPGETNHIVFSADAPGTYWGQCAEFCGLQHGRMKVRVVALDATEWQRWLTNEKQAAATPADGSLAAQGMDLFLGTNGEGGQCIQCHAIGGTDAVGTAAPNLTHFAAPTHECFAGCDFETYVNGSPNVDQLRAWLADPDAVKLGAKMPDYGLTDQQINALIAYLYSLR
jgi:cytochrome c oxidase subunit II